MTTALRLRSTRRFLIGAGAVILASAVITVAVAESATDGGTCSRAEAGTPVVAEFSIPNGAALRVAIPGFGIAPELDQMAGPIQVVVFAGVHQAVPVIGGFNPNAPQPVFEDVVCLVTPDGNESYYYDVDLTVIDIGAVAQ